MQLKAPLTKLITNNNKINTWIHIAHTYTATLIAAAASNNYDSPLITSSSAYPTYGNEDTTYNLPSTTHLPVQEGKASQFFPPHAPARSGNTSRGKCSPTQPNATPSLMLYKLATLKSTHVLFSDPTQNVAHFPLTQVLPPFIK